MLVWPRHAKNTAGKGSHARGITLEIFRYCLDPLESRSVDHSSVRRKVPFDAVGHLDLDLFSDLGGLNHSAVDSIEIWIVWMYGAKT